MQMSFGPELGLPLNNLTAPRLIEHEPATLLTLLIAFAPKKIFRRLPTVAC
jgi:hypothetical protein